MVIQDTKEKDVLSRHDVQRVLGLLNHWSQVIVVGRIFVNRLLKEYRQISPNQEFFSPSKEFRLDIRWWELIAPSLNFKSMMEVSYKGPELTVDMDASTSWGLGAINYVDKEFFLLPTPRVIAGLPIHCAEMAVLMVVVDTWMGISMCEEQMGVTDEQGSGVSLFHSSHVRMRSDNQAVVSAINSGKTKDDFLGIGMRYVHHQMALRDAQLSLSYVSTKLNVWADKLSRGCTETVGSLVERNFRQIFVPEQRLSQLINLDL